MVHDIETYLYGYAKREVPEELVNRIVYAPRLGKPTTIILRLIQYMDDRDYITDTLSRGILLNNIVHGMESYEIIPALKYGNYCRIGNYSIDGNIMYEEYAGGINDRDELLSPDMIGIGIGICLEPDDTITPQTLIGVTSVIADYILKYDLDIDPMSDIHSYLNIIPTSKSVELSKQYFNTLYFSKLKYLVKYLIENPESYPGGFIRQ